MIFFLMPGCAILLVIMWYIFGRDKKTIPTIMTRPPEGLDPLEMDYAQIVTITDRSIYAELLYWVSGRIVEITEEGGCDGGPGGVEENCAGVGRDHVGTERNGDGKDRVGMRRVAELPADAPAHEKFLYQSLFQQGDQIWLDQLPPALTEHKDQLRDLVAERFKGRNAVVQNDTMKATLAGMALLIISVFVIDVMIDAAVLLSAVLAIALFITLTFLQNGALGFQSKHERFEVLFGGIGTSVILIVQLILLKLHTDDLLFMCVFAVCFLISCPCILFMERRVNHRLYGQILGFRRFIETAEWDRLKELSKDDPDYGMDILPYALLFNMGTEWTARFEYRTIYTCVEKMEEMGGNKKKRNDLG